jgi:hypothetical protein
VTDINNRARAIGIQSEASWPYGPNSNADMRLALLGWAEHYKLRMSTGFSRHRWFTCYGYDQSRSGKNHDIYGETYNGLCCRRRWFDHVTCWNRDGKPALILAQPYSLSDADTCDLRELRQAEYVTVRLDVGWYAAGGCSTFAIEVWSRRVWNDIAQAGIEPYEYPGYTYLRCGPFEDSLGSSAVPGGLVDGT